MDLGHVPVFLFFVFFFELLVLHFAFCGAAFELWGIYGSIS